MEIIRICLAAVVFGVVIVYLNGVNKELAALALVAATGIMLYLVVGALSNVFSVYDRLNALGGVSDSLVKTIIKVTLICYIVDFSVGLIEDFGLKSLADKLALFGKVIVIIMATPVLQNLIDVISSLIN